jgi:hypothetical protein
MICDLGDNVETVCKKIVVQLNFTQVDFSAASLAKKKHVRIAHQVESND